MGALLSPPPDIASRAELFRQALALSGQKKSVFARGVGVSPASISAWLTGQTRTPDRAFEHLRSLIGGERPPCASYVGTSQPFPMAIGALAETSYTIDKLTLASDDSTIDLDKFDDALRSANDFGRCRTSKRRNQVYDETYAFPAVAGLYVCKGPYVPRAPYATIEFNPANMTAETAPMLAVLASSLGVEPYVTRVDPAVDYLGVKADEVVAVLLRARKLVVGNSNGYSFTSGSRSSGLSVHGYDYGPAHDQPNLVQFRLEARQKPHANRRPRLPLSALGELWNPFEGVLFGDAEAVLDTSAEGMNGCCLAMARERGVAGTLQHLESNPKERGDFLDFLVNTTATRMAHPALVFNALHADAAARVVKVLSTGDA